ncbi:tol-pal system protein YbgF [Leeia sp. TBRC 13508]|uniref:Cell division coordinator CpoB n=1 Tax=Leeia speluncae TaxID=2884804 RepID=A0ABS8D7B0_9NEIS|nr:tol-pal system protein YbgF [Leeia speluncae]MCB6183866.1 tol-pal system protein YbgF [Leeia speluncae]
MNRYLLRALMAVGMVSAVNGAHAGLFDDDEARKQVADVRVEQQQLADRVSKIEATVNSQKMLELINRIEQLNGQIAKLNGQLEEQAHRLDEMEKRQKDLYLDTDTRLRKIEQAPVAPTPSATVAAAASTTNAAAPQAAGDPAQENATYDAAFAKFRSGNYPAAITGFASFIKSYPNSRYAPNAQYWIGNAYTAQRDYKKAISEQQKLISMWPDSNKVPDAMLNIATAQQELGDAGASKKTLEELVTKFPLTSAADQAKKRLAAKK